MERLRSALSPVALASVAAGGVHLAAAGAHLQESVVLAAAFLVIGSLQVVLGALVWRGLSRPLATALTVIHLVALAAWAASRTVGLPVGHPGPETVGAADLVTVGLELVALAALALRSWRPQRIRQLPIALLLATAGVLLGSASLAAADVGRGHTQVESQEADHGRDADNTH